MTLPRNPTPHSQLTCSFALHLTRQPICKNQNKMQKSKKFNFLRESDLQVKAKAEESSFFPSPPPLFFFSFFFRHHRM